MKTSFEKVIEALEAVEWNHVIDRGAKAMVKEPKADDTTSRRRWVRKIAVDAIGVTFVDIKGRGTTLFFTYSGAFLSEATTSTTVYDFRADVPLKNVLHRISVHAPKVVAERLAKQEDEDARKQAELDAKILANYEAKAAALAAAQGAAFTYLTQEVGISEGAADEIVIALQAGDGNVLLALVGAKAVADRASRGWLDGANSLRGNYHEGRPVEEILVPSRDPLDDL